MTEDFVYNWVIPGIFSLFSSFQQLAVNMFVKIFADDWIQTDDLWYWQQPLS